MRSRPGYEHSNRSFATAVSRHSGTNSSPACMQSVPAPPARRCSARRRGRVPDVMLGYWALVLAPPTAAEERHRRGDREPARRSKLRYTLVFGEEPDTGTRAWMAEHFPEATVIALPDSGHFPSRRPSRQLAMSASDHRSPSSVHVWTGRELGRVEPGARLMREARGANPAPWARSSCGRHRRVGRVRTRIVLRELPGFGQLWVRLDGPFNENLVRDVGALNLALAFVTLQQSCGARRCSARLVTGTWIVEGIPHLVYHLRHLDPLASDAKA